jgi:transposase
LSQVAVLLALTGRFAADRHQWSPPVLRARIVLLAADRVAVKDIVERAGMSKPTVIGWKKRYVAEGVGGLADRPKPGRRRVVDEAALVTATLEPPPERLGVTHWSTRLLAVELGISHVWVGKTSHAVILSSGARIGS